MSILLNISKFNINYAKQKWGMTSMADKVYNILVQSPFVLTQHQVKEKLGTGYRVVSVEVEKDCWIPEITSTENAMDAIIRTGYRALARAYHPDLNENGKEVMVYLNKCKKELETLLKEIKGD